MQSLAAVIPISSIASANATLEAAGFGLNNFGFPAWAGPRPSHGCLMAWRNDAFWQAVKALANVVWQETDDPDVAAHLAAASALVTAQSADWAPDAPALPETGTVQAGSVYYYGDPTLGGTLWRVIQAHDRGVFGGDPAQYPALIRRCRVPGEVAPWVQPLDQFDAYLTRDPFTNEGERVTFGGSTWVCVQGSAGGPGGSLLNSWQPGVFGWNLA